MRNPLRQIKQIRKIRISLAGKCQLLFGTAIVMILSAALAVPWHRIEQLTAHRNERAAGALAEHAIAEHLSIYATASPGDAEYADSPFAPGRPPAGTTHPSTAAGVDTRVDATPDAGAAKSSLTSPTRPAGTTTTPAP